MRRRQKSQSELKSLSKSEGGGKSRGHSPLYASGTNERLSTKFMQRRWQNANTVQLTAREGYWIGRRGVVYKGQPQAGHTQRLTGKCEGGGRRVSNGCLQRMWVRYPISIKWHFDISLPPPATPPPRCCLLLCRTLSPASVGVNKCSQSASFKCCLFTFNFGQHK